VSEFTELLGPLSKARLAALRDDISVNGVREPVVRDLAGVLIDGYHRERIARELGCDLPERRMEFASDAWRRAEALRSNLNRRDVSPEQRAELRRVQQRVYFELRDDLASQERAAAAVGVDRSTCANWDAQRSISDVRSDKANAPDQRVKVTKAQRADIAARVNGGEAQAQIAADHDITQGRVSQVAKQARHASERQERIERDRAAGEGAMTITHADTLAVLPTLTPGSFALLLTDPPYNATALDQYRTTTAPTFGRRKHREEDACQTR
jgi:predicted XRE-type DNA-binding protein